jgi:ABC-2 type transport system ATP-binding protein
MNEIALEIKDLAHSYKLGRQEIQAVKGVTLEVRANEIFGLLGPNGAGKTTLLSCVEGLIQPERGQIKVGGADIRTQPDAAKRNLGIQLQRTALMDNLTVRELVELYAGLYEVYPTASEIGDLLARFELADMGDRLLRRLSGGQQQRLAIAIALAHNPRIVLLDEPSAALDPAARRQVWGMIRGLHEDGRTVVITTHAMEEAEALCGRVAIMDQGQVIACDTPAHLVANLDACPVLKVSLELPLEQARALPGVRWARYSGQYLEMETAQSQATLAALTDLAAGAGRRMGDVSVRQPNLEDVFLKLTGRALST